MQIDSSTRVNKCQNKICCTLQSCIWYVVQRTGGEMAGCRLVSRPSGVKETSHTITRRDPSASHFSSEAPSTTCSIQYVPIPEYQPGKYDSTQASHSIIHPTLVISNLITTSTSSRFRTTVSVNPSHLLTSASLSAPWLPLRGSWQRQRQRSSLL